MHLRYSFAFSASALVLAVLAACGGGGGGGNDATSTSSGNSNSASTNGSSGTASSTNSSTAAASSASSTAVYSTSTCPSITLSATDAQTLTGSSTPIATLPQYGVRSYSAPVKINGLHDPSNYLAAPVLPAWQFATTDPTGGTLSSLECDVGQDIGWHNYHRTSGTSSTITHGKIVVTGGRNATANHIYTVYNGQQLISALNQAGLAPKIIRVVGHIDLRWSANNTVFREYTSYLDQKFGGSISLPSNTTLVGINDAKGNPARITGTTILVGAELGTTTDVMSGATGDPETDFKKWIALGNDGENYPTWTRNIIIRNLKIDTPWDVNPEDSGNAYADGMTVSRSQNIWIDHVSISDGDTPDSIITDGSTRHDGALDIVRGSDYVTVSNSFIGDHGKTTLVGNGDSGRAWSDQNRLHVTLTGMWWYGTASRLPLIRFGQLHSFNNLVEGTTNSPTYGHKFEAGIDVRYSSSVLTENNFHLFTGLKIPELCGKIIGSTSGSEFRTSGNYFISDKYNGKDWSIAWSGPVNVDSVLVAPACAEMPTTDVSWTPPYSYTKVCAAQARRNVEVKSGAGRIGLNAKDGASTDTLSDSSCYDSNIYSASASSASSANSSSSSAASSASSSGSASSSSSSSSSASSTSSTGTLPAGVVSAWADNFDSATAASLTTAAYSSLPTDATLPAYQNLSGTITVSSGIATLTGARLVIGALSSTASTATSSPGGIFNIVGKFCTLVVTAASQGTGTKTFQVYVDNNTTSSSASLHGSSSKVVSVAATSIVQGDNTFTWTLTDATWPSGAGSFIMLRTESGTTVAIDAISLTCN